MRLAKTVWFDRGGSGEFYWCAHQTREPWSLQDKNTHTSKIFERDEMLIFFLYSTTVAARSHRLLLQTELPRRSVPVAALESPGPPRAPAQH